MSTDKKQKHSKKDKASNDILDLAHLTLKKFRKVSKEVGKLSSAQKVMGGVALAAAGLVYLAARDSDNAPEAPEAEDAQAPAADHAAPAVPRKHPKRARFAAEE